MALNPYVVNTDVTVTWDGVSVRIPRGTVIDTPSSGNNGLYNAITSSNLTALTSQQTASMNGVSLGAALLENTAGGGSEPSHYQN